MVRRLRVLQRGGRKARRASPYSPYFSPRRERAYRERSCWSSPLDTAWCVRRWSGLSTKVVGLGTAYFVAAVALDVATHVGNVDDRADHAGAPRRPGCADGRDVHPLDIFVAVADADAAPRATTTGKLALYARFTNVLAVSVVGSVDVILYEAWFRATDALNQKWQVDWVVGAFWHVLSFLLLGAICVWAPSDDAATQFAYGEVSGRTTRPGRCSAAGGGDFGGRRREWRRVLG